MSTTVNRLPELTLTRRGAAKRSRRSLAVKRALLACGIGSSATYVAANVAGALRGGGYSSVNQCGQRADRHRRPVQTRCPSALRR